MEPGCLNPVFLCCLCSEEHVRTVCRCKQRVVGSSSKRVHGEQKCCDTCSNSTSVPVHKENGRGNNSVYIHVSSMSSTACVCYHGLYSENFFAIFGGIHNVKNIRFEIQKLKYVQIK